MKTKDIILLVVSVLLVAVSALLFKEARKKPLERTEYVERVIALHDTLTVLKPVEIVKERKIAVHDTMWVPVHDTTLKRDTLFVPVKREYRTYGDGRYRAVVSGYDPRLERMDIFQQTKVVEVSKRKHWGVGVTLGYGAYYKEGCIRTAPALLVGVTYNFATF